MAGVGTVTLLFTDLVGSTALASRIGDVEIEGVRRAHFATLRAAIAATAGKEVKNLGDGLMVVYRGASDALEGAVAMQRAVDRANVGAAVPLAMKVGVSVGDASEEDGDWFGTPVNEAARLCSAATGGQILVSDVVRILAGSRVRHPMRSAGSLELKGLPDPVSVCEVEWTPVEASDAISMPRALSERGRAVVGRDAQLAALRTAWSAARDGTPEVVLISGEPGVGKTRLTIATAHIAFEDGAIVMFGRCDDTVMAPFRPWIEAVRHLVLAVDAETVRDWAGVRTRELTRLVPEIAERIPGLDPPTIGDPDTERFTLFEAVTALLSGAAAVAPLLIAIDDLHWADAASLLLLRHVMRNTARTRLLFIGTYRDREVDEGSTLARVLLDLKRDSVCERIALSGLDDAATTQLLAGWAGRAVPPAFARVVYDSTDGNPLFIEEILSDLVDRGRVRRSGETWEVPQAVDNLGVPEGVRELVRRRAGLLTDPTQRLLGIAALTGREFDSDVVSRVADVKDDEVLDHLDEAMAVGLVEEVPGTIGRYRFRHAMVRSALEESISTARRARLHLRIGEALEATCPDSLTALAHHYGEATAAGAAKALEYALRAAREALSALAYEEAAVHAESGLRALELVDSADPFARADLLLLLAEARSDMTQMDAAHAAAIAASDEARRLDDTARFVRAVFLYGLTSTITIDDVRTRLVEEALERLPPGDSAERAILMSTRAEWAFLAEDRADLADARDALAMANRTGEPATIAYSAGIVGDLLIGSPHAKERIELAAQALAAADPIGFGRNVFNSLQWMPEAYLELGERTQCEAVLSDFESRARALNLADRLVVLAGCRALLAMIDGRFDDAVRITETATEGAPPDDAYSLIGRIALRVSVARETGDFGELLPQIEMIATLPGFAGVRTEAAYWYLAQGRVHDARTVLDSFKASKFADVPGNWARPSALQDLAEIATACRDAEAATMLLPMLDEYQGLLLVAYAVVTSRGAADRARGQLLAVLGRHNEADTAFDAAEKLEAALGARALLPRTWTARARALLDRDPSGGRSQAIELLERAHAQATSLGMSGLIAEIETVHR